MTSGSIDDESPAPIPDSQLLEELVEFAERLASEDPREDHYSMIAERLGLLPRVVDVAMFSIDEYNEVKSIGRTQTTSDSDVLAMLAVAEDRFDVIDDGHRRIE